MRYMGVSGWAALGLTVLAALFHVLGLGMQMMATMGDFSSAERNSLRVVLAVCAFAGTITWMAGGMVAILGFGCRILKRLDPPKPPAPLSL